MLLLDVFVGWIRAVVWPFAHGLHCADAFLIVLARAKDCGTSPYMFGPRHSDQAAAVSRVERPFLELCWLAGSCLLPVGWFGARNTTCEDSSIASRDRERRIPVRIASPSPAVCIREQPLVILWMHGGGLFLGSAAGESILYRFMAARLAATVVSIGYRKVPEHPFPACIDDWEDVARALLADPARQGCQFVVAGMSAGGYLAIQTALLLAQAGLKVDAHMAIAPMVTFSPRS